jgi:hypothetical protein
MWGEVGGTAAGAEATVTAGENGRVVAAAAEGRMVGEGVNRGSECGERSLSSGGGWMACRRWMPAWLVLRLSGASALESTTGSEIGEARWKE